MHQRNWIIIGAACLAIVIILASSLYHVYNKPEFSPQSEECSDEIDNDNDGFVDFDGDGDIANKDLECESIEDDSESE